MCGVYGSLSFHGLAEAAALGIALVINNRPEGETPDQTPGQEIETAARDAGIAYAAIPLAMPELSDAHVAAMAEALAAAPGPVLAYCRSGTRSTLLWALAQARGGGDPEVIARAAAEAGYDVSPVRGLMEAYSARA